MSESVTFTVSGMKCGGCESNITDKLQALEGVVSVVASHKDEAVTVIFNADIIDEDTLADTIEEAGFAVED